MNLRADLIFASEQRSANVVSLRSITRVASIVGPVIAAGLIAFIVMNALTLANKVKNIEREWLDTEPRKEQALKVLNAGGINDDILSEIETWRHSSVDWAPQFLSIQESISPNIQLDSMRISQTLKQNDKGIAARSFTLSLAGKAVGKAAETAVEGLQKHFIESTDFKDLIASAEIPRYGADPDDKNNRIFQLNCEYTLSLFE
ncbi:MAG: hypothetical protein HN919_13335 [Verrucomicrobia bacterium]|jgi:hypothetical protein|nr:hypothetical protein [Verrucomicrobiota bacterium]MBT7067283.1 hypothetical protein [Verrucomicrobiota bacterium]MBT7698681.1 hypothetical protein [Verrucomicrobiota bacterium]